MDKFTSRKQAHDYAKMETIRTHKKHIVVNSHYWSMDKMADIPSLTVVLASTYKPHTKF